jgi:epoxyqueuosine reductase
LAIQLDNLGEDQIPPRQPIPCDAEWVKSLAREQGFDRVGITSADPPEEAALLEDWLAAGHAGSMSYLHRNREKRKSPRKLVEGAESVICVALNYYQPAPPKDHDRPTGRIARYAWGRDYHKVIKKKLRRIIKAIRRRVGDGLIARAFVDSAPVMERQLAARAGIGWIGKNGLVLHETIGSYFYLGEIVCNLKLEYDAPAADHCGTCRLCLDGCPTDAFPQPYVLDARRCISYTTIEHRGDVDESLREPTGDWLFGCDVCQEVCPYNRQPPTTSEPDLAVREPAPNADLGETLSWTHDQRDSKLAGSAMKRATLGMMRRNAAVALGNVAGVEQLSAIRNYESDSDPLVAEHAAWARDRILRRNDEAGN